jgi:hypothetical protein
MSIFNKLIPRPVEAPTVYLNPFKKENVEGIWMQARKGLFDNKVKFRANVEFSSGSTKGEQKFEGASFEDLLNQIYTFVNAL